MSSSTPNLNLILPEKADYYNSGVHFENYSKLDDAFGDLSDDIKKIILDVKNFGAKGDGTTDDTTSIQNAIDHIISEGGGDLLFPSGNYKISSPLVVNYSSESVGVSFIGAGNENTRISPLNPMECLLNLNCRRGSVEKIDFYGAHPDVTRVVNYCIKGSNLREKVIDGCKFRYAKIHGFLVEASGNNNSLSFTGNCRFEYNGTTHTAGTVSGSGSQVTFSSLDLVANNIGKGAYLIISGKLYEVTSVVNNTTLNIRPNLSSAVSSSAYSLRIGSGLHAARHNDNNLFSISTCHFITNVSCGLFFEGLYGFNVDASSFEFNGVTSIKIGDYVGTPKPAYSSTINKGYFESSGFANILVDSADGLTIIEPLIGTTTQNSLSGLDSIYSIELGNIALRSLTIIYRGKMYNYVRNFNNTNTVDLSTGVTSDEVNIVRSDGATSDTTVTLPGIPTHVYSKKYTIYVFNSGGRPILIKSNSAKVNNIDGTTGVSIAAGKGFILNVFAMSGNDSWIVTQTNSLM